MHWYDDKSSAQLTIHVISIGDPSNHVDLKNLKSYARYDFQQISMMTKNSYKVKGKSFHYVQDLSFTLFNHDFYWSIQRQKNKNKEDMWRERDKMKARKFSLENPLNCKDDISHFTFIIKETSIMYNEQINV